MDIPALATQAVFVSGHLVAAAAFAVIAFTFGCRLTSRVSWSGRGERVVVATSVGLAALGQLLFLLGLAGWLRTPAVAAMLVGVLAVSWGTWRMADHGASLPPWDRAVGLQVTAVMVPVAFVLLLLALYPPTSFDATMYHLPYAKAFAATGGLPYLPDLRFPVFPQLNEVLFAGSLLLDSDIGAQQIETLAALLVAGLLATWPVPDGWRGAGVLAAAIWLGSPMVVSLSGTAVVDLGTTLFFTLAAYAFERWRRSAERPWLTVAAFAAGCAAASKYTGLFAAASIVLLAAWDGRGNRLRAAGWAALISGLTLGPWYLRILLHTGNPVYPLFNEYFAGVPMPLFGSASTMLASNGGLGPALASWVQMPWRLVASQYPSARWSPGLLLGLPVAAWIGFRFPWGRRLGVAILTFSFVFALLSFPDSRLLLPIAPLWAILIAVGCARLIDRVTPAKRWRVQALALLATLLLTPGLWWVAGALARQGRIPVTREQRESYLRVRLPSYAALAHLNQERGEASSVYAVFAENLAYYARGRYQGDWFGPAAYSGVFPTMGDANALSNRLRELGADHLLLSRGHVPLPLREDAAFQRHFELIYSDAAARLYRIVEAPPPPAGAGGS